MTLVCDTGPVIGLAKLDALDLLPSLSESIVVPPAVRRELLGKAGAEATAIDRALATFLGVVTPKPADASVRRATAALDEGERQAITLAAEIPDAVLVIDERVGRIVASDLGLAYTGLVGLLLQLKERGQVPSVTDALQTLRLRGYWLSDSVVASASKLAGEG